MKSFKLYNDAPILKYCQKSLNSCCFSSLSSDFASINHKKASNDISLRIEESLESEVGNRIDFANAILKNEKKGEHKMYYSLVKYKKKGDYNIPKDISENVTLVQLMDYLVNLNHAISVVSHWIFDSNNNKQPILNRESLGMICAPSVGEEQGTKFETLFSSARYIRFDAQLNKY